MSNPTQFIFPVQLRCVQNEVLNGPIDGVNVQFTTVNNFIPNSIQVYLNGLRQVEGPGNDFIIISSNTIQMLNPPLPGDVLISDYFIAS